MYTHSYPARMPRTTARSTSSGCRADMRPNGDLLPHNSFHAFSVARSAVLYMHPASPNADEYLQAAATTWRCTA